MPCFGDSNLNIPFDFGYSDIDEHANSFIVSGPGRPSSSSPLNPLVTNGLSHPYHLDESIFILGALGLIFHFYFIFR